MDTSHPLPCDILISSPPPTPAPWQGELVPASVKGSKQSSFYMCIFFLYGLDCKVIRKHGLVPQAPDRRPDLCPGSQDWPEPDNAPPGLSPLQSNSGLRRRHHLSMQNTAPPSLLRQQPDLGPVYLLGEGITGEGCGRTEQSKKGFIVLGAAGEGMKTSGTVSLIFTVFTFPLSWP